MQEDYNGNEELESHDESNLEIGPPRAGSYLSGKKMLSSWDQNLGQKVIEGRGSTGGARGEQEQGAEEKG